MTLMVVKILTLNQCVVIWNKITVVAVMLLVIKKETCKFITRMESKSDIFKDFSFNLGI